jgi:hypothetical protein
MNITFFSPFLFYCKVITSFVSKLVYAATRASIGVYPIKMIHNKRANCTDIFVECIASPWIKTKGSMIKIFVTHTHAKNLKHFLNVAYKIGSSCWCVQRIKKA